ncbi:CLUMA_CG020568, isoform A [Clunio marinus]|uniref:CLUMA_CG020568, isoform A n=1 Tax=Clunio marinus TaxID=568069 RepID=A0A1J1J5B8_9DIPT|nr:CLUMA_CG020568, isoform A [Clunio marinus]
MGKCYNIEINLIAFQEKLGILKIHGKCYMTKERVSSFSLKAKYKKNLSLDDVLQVNAEKEFSFSFHLGKDFIS